MDRARGPIAVVAALTAALTMASSASALTLGTPTFPTTNALVCGTSTFYVQGATDSAYDYVVPAGGGLITSWSTGTTLATAGVPITFLVLRPTATAGQYTIVATDAEHLPNPLPLNAIATFPIADPIAVTGGEHIGLFTSAVGDRCAFNNGVPAAETEDSANVPFLPAVGGSLQSASTATATIVDVSANLVTDGDAAVSGAATPASITAPGVSQYLYSVTDVDGGAPSISFTDTVPAGLTVLSAIADSGSCAVAGQVVTCTLHPPAGASAPVSIVVSAAAAGTYVSVASVSAALPDPLPANNSATATLTVTAPAAVPTPPPASTPTPTPTPVVIVAAAHCHVVRLTGTPLAVAKALLTALDCTVHKTTKKTSKTVRKGLVISTSPSHGTLAAGAKINVVESSGPPKRRTTKKHRTG